METTIDDLKKECQYCYREIDNSGLEGFRCTNRTAIKARDSSWCYPKNANEPCSICEYCEPKQNIEMTIDDCIYKLDFSIGAYKKLIDENVSNGEVVGTGVRGTCTASTPLNKAYSDMIEALQTAKDTMRKYQKIEDIYYHQRGEALENSLRAVIEDGNVD